MATQMDKLGTYLGDNIFGRQEILNGEKKIDKTKRQINELANSIIMQMLELAQETNSLALERAERKYRAELAAVDIKVRHHSRS